MTPVTPSHRTPAGRSTSTPANSRTPAGQARLAGMRTPSERILDAELQMQQNEEAFLANQIQRQQEVIQTYVQGRANTRATTLQTVFQTMQWEESETTRTQVPPTPALSAVSSARAGSTTPTNLADALSRTNVPSPLAELAEEMSQLSLEDDGNGLPKQYRVVVWSTHGDLKLTSDPFSVDHVTNAAMVGNSIVFLAGGNALVTHKLVDFRPRLGFFSQKKLQPMGDNMVVLPVGETAVSIQASSNKLLVVGETSFHIFSYDAGEFDSPVVYPFNGICPNSVGLSHDGQFIFGFDRAELCNYRLKSKLRTLNLDDGTVAEGLELPMNRRMVKMACGGVYASMLGIQNPGRGETTRAFFDYSQGRRKLRMPSKFPEGSAIDISAYSTLSCVLTEEEDGRSVVWFARHPFSNWTEKEDDSTFDSIFASDDACWATLANSAKVIVSYEDEEAPNQVLDFSRDCPDVAAVSFISHTDDYHLVVCEIATADEE
mmetsp:Transcript_62692/g.152605  ORF Transcript_62692/g.152605 Transcript_62692/m.152605 type:complete len:488 (+) Transcript_62692:534-1997(+)